MNKQRPYWIIPQNWPTHNIIKELKQFITAALQQTDLEQMKINKDDVLSSLKGHRKIRELSLEKVIIRLETLTSFAGRMERHRRLGIGRRGPARRANASSIVPPQTWKMCHGISPGYGIFPSWKISIQYGHYLWHFRKDLMGDWWYTSDHCIPNNKFSRQLNSYPKVLCCFHDNWNIRSWYGKSSKAYGNFHLSFDEVNNASCLLKPHHQLLFWHLSNY